MSQAGVSGEGAARSHVTTHVLDSVTGGRLPALRPNSTSAPTPPG
ncbi:hypothetical protein [Cryobacterium sp. TMT1-3]